MFIPMIAAVVVLIVMVAYMSTSHIVTDASEIKMGFEKVKHSYDIEKVIVNAVEDLCQRDSTTCTNKKDSNNNISLTLSDLAGYIPDNFQNSNLLGGSFTGIDILNNYTTIRVTHNIPKDTYRKLYLTYYLGKQYSIPPKCVSGSETSIPACSTDEVYHDYATDLYTRAALE